MWCYCCYYYYCCCSNKYLHLAEIFFGFVLVWESTDDPLEYLRIQISGFSFSYSCCCRTFHWIIAALGCSCCCCCCWKQRCCNCWKMQVLTNDFGSLNFIYSCVFPINIVFPEQEGTRWLAWRGTHFPTHFPFTIFDFSIFQALLTPLVAHGLHFHFIIFTIKIISIYCCKCVRCCCFYCLFSSFCYLYCLCLFYII